MLGVRGLGPLQRDFVMTRSIASVCVSVLFPCMAAATAATAEQSRDGFYATFALGIAADYDEEPLDLPGSTFDTNVDLALGYSGILGAVGYDFGNGFRVEGSLGYTRQDIGSLSARLTAATLGDTIYSELMINGYYDFRSGHRFQPYVGLGIGGARLSYKGTSLDGAGLVQVRESDVHPAAQVMLGLGWWTADKTFLGLEYNYIRSITDVNVRISSTTDGITEFDTHRLLFKFRYMLK